MLRGPGYRRRYSYSLWAGRSGDRIQVETRYFALVQTVPGDHPVSYMMNTGSFPGIKWPGRDVDHPLTSSVEIKARVELDTYSPSGPSWSFLRWTSLSFTLRPCSRPLNLPKKNKLSHKALSKENARQNTKNMMRYSVYSPDINQNISWIRLSRNMTFPYKNLTYNHMEILRVIGQQNLQVFRAQFPVSFQNGHEYMNACITPDSKQSTWYGPG